MSLKCVLIFFMFSDIINVRIRLMNARSKSLTALSACSLLFLLFGHVAVCN